MKFLAIIPARYASTRFPGKPLALIGGKPMVRHVYEKASVCFPDVYVATDDERIAAAIDGFGGRSVMTSPAHRSGTDRCAEALNAIEKISGSKFDIVVNIQGDEPFLSGEHLTKLRSAFDAPGTMIATLVKKFGKDEDIFDPGSPKVVLSVTGDALYFSRTPVPYLRDVQREFWQREYVYYKHIGLYAYRSEVLREITRLPAGKLETAESLEQLRWLENGYRIRAEITSGQTLAVDTPSDLEKVQIFFDALHISE